LNRKNRISFCLLAVCLLCASVLGLFTASSGARVGRAQLFGAELYAATYSPSPYLAQTNVLDLHNAGITGKRADGTRVRVAVIDTGIDYNHAAFKDADGNSIVSPLSYNATTQQCVADAGYSVIMDEYVTGEGYHGTACAGMIVSQLADYRGVAPDCELVVIKCLWGDSGFQNADLIRAMEYALSVDCSVISISWGIGDDAQTHAAMEALVAQAKEKNCTVVCAAGNTCSTRLSLPANLSDVICVGAVDKNNAKAVYSNYGPGIDVVAPGNVTAVLCGGGTYTANGTSFAAPIVAGIAALYYSAHPDATVQDVTYALTFTAKDLGSAGIDNLFGYGLVNALGAVTAKSGTLTLLSGTSYVRMPFYFDYPVQGIPDLVGEDATFAGWYLDDSYRRKVTFPMSFSQNVTLIARWKYNCRIYIDGELVRSDQYDKGNIISYPAKNGFTLDIPDKPTYMGTESLDLHGTWVLKDITVNNVTSGIIKTYDGEPVTLTLDATHPLGVTYTWYRDGEVLADVTGNTLTLAGNPGDSGEYRCEAAVTAEGQTKIETADFAVYIDPIVLDVPTAQDTVYTGEIQTPSLTDWDETVMQITLVSVTDAGTYEMQATILDDRYTFPCGHTATITWLVEPAENVLDVPFSAWMTIYATLTDAGDGTFVLPREGTFAPIKAKWGMATTDADPASFTQPGTYVVTYFTPETANYTSAGYNVTLVVNAPPVQNNHEGMLAVWIAVGAAAIGAVAFILHRRKRKSHFFA